jgi:hypothetical protein
MAVTSTIKRVHQTPINPPTWIKRAISIIGTAINAKRSHIVQAFHNMFGGKVDLGLPPPYIGRERACFHAHSDTRSQ